MKRWNMSFMITNTRKDTNGLAHVLMDRFGDFAGVLDASEGGSADGGGGKLPPPGCCIFLPQVAILYPVCR